MAIHILPIFSTVQCTQLSYDGRSRNKFKLTFHTLDYRIPPIGYEYLQFFIPANTAYIPSENVDFEKQGQKAKHVQCIS
jgi:hypothetical protein